MRRGGTHHASCNIVRFGQHPPPTSPTAAADEAIRDKNGLPRGTRVRRVRVPSVKLDMFPALFGSDSTNSRSCRHRRRGLWKEVWRQGADCAWTDTEMYLEFGDFFDQGTSTEINHLLALNNSRVGGILSEGKEGQRGRALWSWWVTLWPCFTTIWGTLLSRVRVRRNHWWCSVRWTGFDVVLLRAFFCSFGLESDLQYNWTRVRVRVRVLSGNATERITDAQFVELVSTQCCCWCSFWLESRTYNRTTISGDSWFGIHVG